MLTKSRVDFLDGIRGFAVLLVVLYHFYPDIFLGGYSGVDIFFMLSGFLITKAIIKNHLNLNREFDYFDFYASRVTRIFPAFLLVISSVLIIGWFVLENAELELMARHTIYSIFQIVNYVLWYEDGYFSVSSNYKVFLHMWSLSVEWQIYVVAPFITLFAVKIFRLSLKSSFIVLFVALLGMLLFVHISTYWPTGAYYFTLLRIWAFFLGMAICFFENSHSETKNKHLAHCNQKNTNTILICFLLPLVIAINVLITPKYFNFAYVNSISVIAASLMILFRNTISPKNLLYTFAKPLVGLGIISFSVYLWHWPVLFFSRILGVGNSIGISTISIFTIIGISSLTYFFVEKPINNLHNKKVGAVKLLILAIFLSLLAALIVATNGAPNRFLAKIDNYESPVIPDEKSSLYVDCASIPGVQDSWCLSTNKTKVLLLGDSHARLFFKPLVESKHEIFSKVLNIGAGNCHASIGPEISERCNKQITETIHRLDGFTDFKISIISGWNLSVTHQNVEAYKVGYSKLFDVLLSKDIQPIFIIDNPTLKNSPQMCNALSSRIYLRNKLTTYDPICFSLKPENFLENLDYEHLINYLSKKYENVRFINLFNKICEDMTCTMLDSSNNLLYSDEGHLSNSASKKATQYLLKELDK